MAPLTATPVHLGANDAAIVAARIATFGWHAGRRSPKSYGKGKPGQVTANSWLQGETSFEWVRTLLGPKCVASGNVGVVWRGDYRWQTPMRRVKEILVSGRIGRVPADWQKAPAAAWSRSHCWSPYFRSAPSSPLIGRIHADQRQVPVRLSGMVLRHLLDDREEIAGSMLRRIWTLLAGDCPQHPQVVAPQNLLEIRLFIASL